MKLLLSILLLCFSLVAEAAEVKLAWDDPNQPTWQTRIYIGTESKVYTNSQAVNAGVSETVIKNLVEGTTYFFTARHFTETQESGDSNEVTYTVPESDRGVLPPLDSLPEIKGYEFKGLIFAPIE